MRAAIRHGHRDKFGKAALTHPGDAVADTKICHPNTDFDNLTTKFMPHNTPFIINRTP